MYFSVPPSSWLCGPEVEAGCAPVFRCLPSADHTRRLHGYSPLGGGLLRLLILCYSCHYQQWNNACHALAVIKRQLTCFFLLFVTELDDQILVFCILFRPLPVGGFKLAAQAFHLGCQFSIVCRDSLNLVKAPFSVPCGLHQVLHINKLSQTVRLNGRIKWSSQTYLNFCHQTFCCSFNFRRLFGF